MNFVLLFGPPAVGKMTVGQELSKLTGYPLFHNHMTIEFVLPLFPFDHPSFRHIIQSTRKLVFDEAIKNNLGGLIFTYAWATTDEADTAYVRWLRDYITGAGAKFYFAELEADLATRLLRNKTPNRLENKASKRDLEFSEKNLLDMDAKYVMQTTGEFPFPDPYVRVENSSLSPQAAAKIIQESLGLKCS